MPFRTVAATGVQMPFHWTDRGLGGTVQRGYFPAMAVQKAIDLTGTGGTVEEAVAEALDRAALTLQGITRFDVVSLAGSVEGGRIAYEAHVRVWFSLLERVHG
ncbi:MAG TPA: dodecin domain-containing protein [Actinoplanes sp.]|jgi:flavin-binding protein dodecin